ncbi:MAG TPA: hypothetical protein VFX59_00350 [Polyangiales bacterium]|nr:hypothetical protein [Polyangiales bacterium]
MRVQQGLLFWLTVCCLISCGGDDAPSDDPPAAEGSYEDVAALLGVGESRGSTCALASCHGASGEGELSLPPGADLRALLVDVPACEAPGLSLVKPGAPDESWLWIKLNGEIEDEDSGDLVVDPKWGEPGTNCRGADGFGKRMPRVAPFRLAPSSLATIRAWIANGAPGPSDD